MIKQISTAKFASVQDYISINFTRIFFPEQLILYSGNTDPENNVFRHSRNSIGQKETDSLMTAKTHKSFKQETAKKSITSFQNYKI